MSESPREKLIRTAQRLFYRNGIHATGVDKIVAEAGVAKMTLYKHFKTKNDLVLAALRRADEEFRNSLMRTVERKGRTPLDRLLALFDALHEWCAQDDFPGCHFINAAAEFSSHDHPIHVAAANHKKLVLAYVVELATAAKLPNPAQTAKQLFLLMQGAIVARQLDVDADACMKARGAAEELLKA